MFAAPRHHAPMRRSIILASAPLVLTILACGLSGESDEPPPPLVQPPSAVAPPIPTPTPAPAPSGIVNHEATGNIAPTRPPMGCIEPSRVETSMNPADLYASMEACAVADRPDDALFLFAVAGVYARFDTLRVADRSAHGGAHVLNRRHVNAVPPAQWAPIQQRLGRTSSDPAELAPFCARVRAAGPPTYHPAYLIQHGMGAVLGQGGDPLVAGFDAPAAWESALDSYLHCPPAT
jgi:hypothetical protein